MTKTIASQKELTERAIQSLSMLARINGEPEVSLPKNPREPVVITVEMFHRLCTEPDFVNRLMGFKSPLLLTVQAAVYILAQSHTK